MSSPSKVSETAESVEEVT